MNKIKIDNILYLKNTNVNGGKEINIREQKIEYENVDELFLKQIMQFKLGKLRRK